MKNLLLILVLLPTLCLAGPGGVGGGNGSSLSRKNIEMFILHEQDLDPVLSIMTVDGQVISVEDIKKVFSFEGKVILPKGDIVDVQLVNGAIIPVTELEKALVSPSYFCDPENFTDECHHN